MTQTSFPSAPEGITSAKGPDPGLRRNVWIVGLTSMLTDISSEMIYPLLAPFLVLTLGARPAQVGIIEGLAECTAALLKVFSGWLSDRVGRRKPITWLGYALSSIGKLLMYLAGSWAMVLFARLLERTGKGIRTAPRDALITESVPKEARGHAFGIRTTLDFLGGFIGVGLAWLLAGHLLVSAGPADAAGIRTLFGWALVPAALALIVPAFLREPAPRTVNRRPLPSFSLEGYPASLKAFLAASLVFNIGNSSNQFLLLRSKDVLVGGGLNAADALQTSILFYLLFKAVVTLLGAPLGRLSDRVGRKHLLVVGYVIFAVSYALFARVSSSSGLWTLWALYGAYTALTDGLEKALISDLAPPDRRATAQGLYGTVVGLALLPASMIAGYLYEWTPGAPFLFGGALAIVAAVMVLVGVRQTDLAAAR